MVCSLFGAAFAAEEETATPYVIPDVDGKVVILHTNDTHGADLDEEGASFGMAGVAQLKKDFEAAGADVLLVSAGDSIMGKPLVSADQGKSAIEFMNAAGYDAMTVGNHELDFGIDNLKALAKDADFPILCADMTTEADGKTVFDSNKIFEIGGVKVGVFGLATPETLTKADASKMPGITFPQTDKLYAVAQAQVDELNKAGADLIVCLGHLGIDDESIGNRSIDVCEHVNGIDLFIDGHSHSTTADIIAKVGDTNVVNGAKIVSTGTALANVGVVIYDQETGTLTDELVPAATYTIATNDFTAKGGDTYGVFKIAGGWKDVGVSLEDALINYTTEELDGTITAGQYGEPAGRITIVDEPANYPADLETGSWYYNAAVYALDNGIMNGTNKGFEPTGTVTRATVYQTLYNMEGKPAVEKTTVTGTEGKWYANAINWAASAGLFEGTEYGTDTVITRSGIATIIADYASYKGITVDTSGMAMKEAPDYDSIPAADLEGMTFCYYGKVMTGDQKGNLNPNGQLTRAEFAQVLKNFSVLKPTYVETVVSIPVAAQDGIPAHEIPATLTLPVSASKDAKVPGVVMLHGTGSNRDEAGMGYALAAPRMAADGIATLRIDFLGNGGSPASYRDYNYTSAVIDAKAAADYLAGLETVDGGNLGVMGWSQGGTDALLAAEAHPGTFQAVVTWSGALELNGASLFAGTSFEDAYAQAKKEGFYTMTFDWREPLELGERWFQEVAETNILKVTADIKAPILAINGKDDTTVTPDNAEKIVKAAANADSQLLLVDNCDHTYNVFSGDFTALYQTVDATAAFFQAQLIPAAAQAAA